MIPEFEHIPFQEPEQAQARLQTVLDPSLPAMALNLAAALERASDPDLALTRLQRFLEISPTAAEERGLIAESFEFARMTCTILDQSHMLTDILCRKPEYLQWLWRDAALTHAIQRDAMVADMLHWIEGCANADQGALAMRRFKQREILRIATRDIYKSAPLDSITLDLANLADAALEAALRLAAPEYERRYGTPSWIEASGVRRPSQFVIMGMGKLGGCELNFSSDIDLIFLFSGAGETTGGESGSISNLEYYQKLGERVIKLVSLQTGEGFIFRVDMRLRPYGRMSALAISLPNALDYYGGGYAQQWELQALIKTRPVAGDLDLGELFVEETRPLVFPRYFDDERLDAIRQIKLQMENLIEDRHETDIEVKLGRGGIRDIEFTVQMLQMLNGGRMPDLRVRPTLEAIRALGRRAHLGALEATALASNYTFLRHVEHRLQIEGGRQLHVLPAEPRELDLLARRLGYASGESFMADFRDRTEETRAILDRFLAVEGAGTLWTYDLLSMQSDGRIGKERLAQHYGFQDPDRAREELLLLCAGPPQEPFALHVRQLFAAIAPDLLEALSASGDPDGTLMRLSRIVANVRAPGALYESMTGNPAYSEYLVKLVSNSEYLSEIMARDPGLFEVFSPAALNVPASREELEELLDTLLRAADPEAAPYRFRDGELLRVGLRELFREVSIIEVGLELTQLAEVCLAYALRRGRVEVEERFGRVEGSFAVLAVGKLGGREMGYGSDLDLVFVYETGAKTESGMSPAEYFATIASRALNRLKEPTRYGLLYHTDVRLRPDGKKGELMVSDRRLDEYYRQEAQPWERLALMKVRAVGGDTEFARHVEVMARDAAFDLALTPGNADHVEDMRSRLAKAAPPWDLKRGEGGLAELEIAVRLLQARHAPQWPELKRGDVLGALDALAEHNALPTEHHDALRDAYLLLRLVENRIRMRNGRSSSELPEDPAARADLGRRLGIEGDLLEVIDRHRAAVHAVYQSVLGDIR